MVELATLQAVSYIMGSLGVFVAAVYYVMNLRKNRKNVRITLTNNIMQTLGTPAGMKNLIELLHTEWTDYQDFERKYGTENNLESSSVRLSTWYTYNTLGELLKKGLVDEDTLYTALGWNVVVLWEKFKSVAMEHRRRYMSRDQWTGFEYLAGRMLAKMLAADPSYTVPETYDKYIPEK
jgi:hypothetical protein